MRQGVGRLRGQNRQGAVRRAQKKPHNPMVSLDFHQHIPLECRGQAGGKGRRLLLDVWTLGAAQNHL